MVVYGSGRRQEMVKDVLEEIYRSASKLASAKHSIVLGRRGTTNKLAASSSGSKPASQGKASPKTRG